MRDSGRGLRQRRSLLSLLTLLVVCAIGVAGFEYCRRAAAAESGNVARLASIVGKHRLTRARLSGGFAYVACQPPDSTGDRLVHGLVCAGPRAASWKSAERLRKFAAYMRSAGQNGSAPADAHFAGIWDLVWGSTDAAVTDLRDAVRREPANARALNDLAVALTESAEERDDPSALIDAFVAADSAVRQDSTLRESQFTLAVLLEHLYLRPDAIEAWKRYLQLDSSSPWAAEARERLTALESRRDQWQQARGRLLHALSISDTQTVRSIVVEFPSDTRTLIELQLGAWGDAIGSGETTRAREPLDNARKLAGPLRAATGDALMSDAISVIDRALAGNDTTRLRVLANGHAVLPDSGERVANRALAEAHAETSRQLFASAGSPMRDWASYQQALAQLLLRQQDAALTLLTAIRDSAPPQYVALRSYAALYRGFIYDVRSDYSHSLAAYDTALAESWSTGDPQITLRAGSWLALLELPLRGREAAWRTLYAVLAATPRYVTSYKSLYSTFDYAGRLAADESPRLALRYSEESIRIARLLKDPATMSYALGRRAEELASMGQTDPARADVVAALDAAQQIANTTGRATTMADAQLSSGYVALHTAPAQAETVLRRVIDDYTATKYHQKLPAAYLYLAQSRVAAGKIEPARDAFDSATSLMLQQRATVKDYAERGAFLDEARTVIDQIVAFHAGHSSKDAFAYFEGNRSRVLLEQLEERQGESAEQPRDLLAALQRRLAKDDVVLSYAVLPREMLIWTIGRDRFEQHHVSVTSLALKETVDQFRRSLLSGSAEPDAAASERLYHMLLDSAGHLDRGANLIVIPDRWLHSVPFVALRDSSSGRYLVRDHVVSYAPSATLLVSSLARAEQRFSRSSRVLAIGNPAFDRRKFELPDLPGAELEARRIASLYANETLLTGRDATDAELERLAPSFDILHFAGHAVVGRDAPQLSHLVLASDGSSDGDVFTPEIAQWKLTRTRLVILSGCSTAGGKLSATEGASSLARAFFAAGVPAVLSSLWDIDDDDTADFFVAFHGRLAAGMPAAVALHETQIRWLGDGRTPAHPVRSWAAFQIFGD